MLAEMEINCQEQFDQRKLEPRKYPAMMILPGNVINDPGAPVILPPWAIEVWVSAQLAFVCGSFVNDAVSAQSQGAVFGYTLSLCFNTSGMVRRLRNPTPRDISVNEDYGRWLDGFRPLGPSIVTRDEFDLVRPRSLQLTVGAERLTTSTSAMLHSPVQILCALSEHIPFYPGDVVGLGAMGRDLVLPSELPEDGLEVAVEVEGIGKLTTIVKRDTRPGQV
jgi:2-keto-4-pentenoate hydratase/2-oxohepta-3-ene-1,7-dioic acid hydratase in catechol pathway